MDALLQQALNVLREVWRRRWIGLAVAWVGAIIGAVVVAKMPDRYEATARLYVDTDSVLKPLMSGLAVQPDINQQLAILSRTLISRPNVEKLVRMADLDLGTQSAAEREAIIDSVTKSLSLGGSGRDNLYSIAYRHTEPEKARKVVQSLLSIFVESSLGDKKKDGAAARKFIDEQIAAYAEKLDEAENRLKEFKLRNLNLGIGGGTDSISKVAAAQKEYEKASLELRAAQQSRDALKRELAGEDPVYLPQATPTQAPSEVPSARIAELDKRLEAQKSGLDELLRRFTDAHPDVMNTRRIINDLEAEREKAVAAMKKPAPAPTTPAPRMASASTNPVFQQIKISLAEAEASVASLQARATELETRYRQAVAASRALPQAEAELAQLNRDYDVQKKNYESLVSRRESAMLSGEMDASASAAEFRVIDPPRVSPKPVAPNRMLLLGAAFAAALAAGLAASFLTSQLFPTFHDARSLRQIADRPVLGTVSLLKTADAVRLARRRILSFFTAFGALVGCYAAAFAFLIVSTRPV
jgi:polysaccharide chain length determinant protein (PEP-CTERM system associated)